MQKRSRKPEDENQLAHQIIQAATGGQERPEKAKDPLAVELGRRGGLKGGIARKLALSPEERTESAKKAAKMRWEAAKTSKNE